MAPWNHFVKTQFKKSAAFQIFRGKIPHYISDAQAAQGKLYDHIAGRQFKFRIDAHAVFGQKRIHAASCAGILLQGDERQVFQVMQIQCFIFILEKLSSCHKNIFYFPDGLAVYALA